MINLRYHIVSLTAVFLAIGIGLTLGSTFLDRATVENLNGQLENLEARLGDRDEQINELQSDLDRSSAVQSALDEQGAGLLAGRMEGTPVVVIAAQGVDEDDVDRAVQTLQVSGAEVQGLWWLTERLLLDSDAAVSDLATALDEPSQDPARLRRLAVDAIGQELRTRQRQEPLLPGGEGAVGEEGSEDPTGEVPGEAELGEETPDTSAPDDGTDVDGTDDPELEDVTDDAGVTRTRALLDAGFITFEAVTDGAEDLELAPGTRLVVVGGSSVLPDDVFVEPLVERLARGTTSPTLTVIASAMADPTQVAEVVSVVRADERLRSLVTTVDSLDHFHGWMALALAVDDLGDRVVGHYGSARGPRGSCPRCRRRERTRRRAAHPRPLDGDADGAHRGEPHHRLRPGGARRRGARHHLPRQHVPVGEHHPEHRVRALRGRRPAGRARPRARGPLRPRGRRRRRAAGRLGAGVDVGGPGRPGGARCPRVAAADASDGLRRGGPRGPRRPGGARHGLPPDLPAPGARVRRRPGGHGGPPRPGALRPPGVRPGREQPRRVRGLRHVLVDAPR
jgi:hypothetical protein